jgi:GalNAc5-diNAcBac-PP-undecaprenol beta-1,3-glucosyltransferase
MYRASVLIPTHGHRAATLPFAVASVQAQDVEDIEILIVGDGVDDSVRSTVERLQAADSRIRFFDFEKGPRNGEIHRDGVLRQARGRIVCYQADDDLWLPGHLEDMETALENADFVGAMHVNVDLEGRARGYFFDLERPEFREPWLIWQNNHYGSWASNGFGLAFAAHRLDSYLRLPEGWSTTPTGLPTDQFMWIKFARQPWCRIRSLQWPISLHFPAPDRRNWTPEQRTEELRRWMKVIESPDYAVRIWRDLMPDLGDRLLSQSLKERGPRLEAAEERVRQLEAQLDGEREAAVTRIRELENQVDGEREAAVTRIRELENQVEAVAEAASAQVTELQTRADAEKVALVARIRELENQADAITEAASAQVTELQTRAEAEKVALVARIGELENQIKEDRNAVLSSTSWRITAPLRRVIDRLRRFKSG